MQSRGCSQGLRLPASAEITEAASAARRSTWRFRKAMASSLTLVLG